MGRTKRVKEEIKVGKWINEGCNNKKRYYLTKDRISCWAKCLSILNRDQVCVRIRIILLIIKLLYIIYYLF